MGGPSLNFASPRRTRSIVEVASVMPRSRRSAIVGPSFDQSMAE
jgi:hypothetical protein